MELFEKKKEPKHNDNIEEIGEISSKLRLLEERYNLVRKKTQLSEQNLIEFQKDIDDEIKTLNEEMVDFKRILQKMNDEVDILVGKTDEFARGDEIRIIAKYLEYINPTRFITKEDAEKIINNFIKQKTIKKEENKK